MPTHAQLAIKLLKDSSAFFKTLAQENAAIAKQMNENIVTFQNMVKMLETNPAGNAGGRTYGVLAAELLKDAAKFFRTIGGKNEPIREQMHRNADIYEQIADLVAADPLGVMD